MKRTLISSEQRAALIDQPEGIEVEDPQTKKIYVLTDAEWHQRAMRALQQQEVRDAIQAGLDDAEAGRVESFEDVDARIRAKLGIESSAS